MNMNDNYVLVVELRVSACTLTTLLYLSCLTPCGTTNQWYSVPPGFHRGYFLVIIAIKMITFVVVFSQNVAFFFFSLVNTGLIR